jgi:UDP:flavonoid glycosyltransferase YjiC (YdhE family)
MTTLARKLQSRGHDVVFISLPDGEAAARAAGLAFLPCGGEDTKRNLKHVKDRAANLADATRQGKPN